MKNKLINIDKVKDRSIRGQFLRLVGEIIFTHQVKLKINSPVAKAA